MLFNVNHLLFYGILFNRTGLTWRLIKLNQILYFRYLHILFDSWWFTWKWKRKLCEKVILIFGWYFIVISRHKIIKKRKVRKTSLSLDLALWEPHKKLLTSLNCQVLFHRKKYFQENWNKIPKNTDYSI